MLNIHLGWIYSSDRLELEKMNWFTGIIVFLLVWWVSIFLVLPFGHNRDVDGTPVIPHLKRKLLLTTFLAVFIWAGIYILIESDLISFRKMINNMEAE
jgi:predicted secreted protein